MGMFGPGKEGWLAEAEMLSWAFRHLKAEERDYLTKRLKHVLGKRTLKGSWFEKDKSLVEMLVAGPAHRAGLGSLPLMTAANTEKMHALDYPGLSEDKTPEAFFRRVEAAATHEKSKEAMRAFHEEIDGTPYDRRAFAMLIIYICGFGLSWYAKAFLERYCREFGANSQTTLSISFDPSLYEGKDGDPEGEEASAGEKSEKPSQEQAPAEAVPAGASETEGAREAPAQTGDEVPGVEAAKVAESAAEPAPVVPAPVVPVPAEGAKASTVFPRDFSVTVPPLPRGVTRYLGYIRTSGGNFFNFYVLAEWYKDRFGALESEAKQLFPSYGAFNLKSAGRNQIKEGAFYVIDLYPSDLMQNFDENGRVRSDFCKFVDFSRITSSKRFFSASDFGIHLVVKPAEDLDRIDFTSTMIPVSVTDSEDLEGEMKVANEFVLLEHKDCFYGPLRLKRDNRGKNYVTFSGTVNKGLVSAFRIKADKVEEVREYVRWEGAGQPVHVGVRCAKTAFMDAVSVDVWSDADLLRRLLEKSAVRAVYIRDRLQSPEAFEDVEPDVTAGRLARARNVMRRLQYKEEVKEHVANFVLDEIRAGNDAMIDAVISRVAVGDKLIDKISAKTLVGVRVERLKAEEKTLSENIRVQEGKRDELTRKYASLEISKKELDAELRRKALASCLLDAKKDVIEQLLKLDGMLEKRRENYRRLENLHTKLLEESKRICERTHGADGELMPESLVRALDAWTEDDDRSRRERLAQAVCGVRPAKLRGRELADALVRSVQEVRRYDENTVLNLYICWAQNFLTVLSGEPGSGKTSICHILARTLGLDAFDNLLSSDERAGLSAGRFVHVPVEYGWTSKRDFVGYWNPITNRFESSDPARWDLLRTLDAEERSASGSVYPAMMLLDEANLSPMEYYWSDWMRLCDEQTSSGIVTLWDKAPTKVPETLRFMATINNDSTTETLSPRLIDRAAVVTLPVVDCIENTSPAKVVGPVSWKELQAYFGVKAVSKNARELSDLHDRLMPMLEGFGIRLSPRSIRQMNGYVGAASSIFADGDKPAWLDAADFAVMQKCLPRITGTGAAYREKLVEFRSGLESLGLSRSVEVVDRILRQGDEAMDCYRFF